MGLLQFSERERERERERTFAGSSFTHRPPARANCNTFKPIHFQTHLKDGSLLEEGPGGTTKPGTKLTFNFKRPQNTATVAKFILMQTANSLFSRETFAFNIQLSLLSHDLSSLLSGPACKFSNSGAYK